MICIKKKQVPGGTTMHPCQVVEQLVLTLPNIFISQPQTHTQKKTKQKKQHTLIPTDRENMRFLEIFKKELRTDQWTDGWTDAGSYRVAKKPLIPTLFHQITH